MHRYFWEGLVEAIPLAASLSAYALVFGMLAQQSGLAVSEIFCMSALVFAGASQFAVLPLLQDGASIFTMIMATYVINLRHYLMAASLNLRWPQIPLLKRGLLAFFLIDENFALAAQNQRSGRALIYSFAGSGLLLYLAWVVPSTLGARFGALIHEPAAFGLDFVFPAAFLGLLVPLIRRKSDLVVAILAAVLSVLGAALLPGKWYIVIAGIGASFAGLVISDARRMIR